MTFWPSNSKAKLRPLKHLARLNPEVLSEETDPDFEFDYIDIGGVTLEEGVRQKEPMRFEAAPSRARKPVRTGDVIVSTVRTYLKAVARIDDTHNGAIVSTGFAVLRPNADVDAGYLYRLCQANPFVGDVQAQSTGVSYPAINPSALAALKVPLPNLDTQKAIAAYLDRETARIDQLIAKKERQVKLLTEKLSRTINVSTSSGQPMRLKHLRKFLTSGSRGWGDNYADSGSIFVRIGNVTGRGINVDYSDLVYVDVPANSEGTRTAIEKGDVLISITAELGAVAVADERCCGGFVNQHVALLRIASNKANPRYVAYALQNDRSQQQFIILGCGGTKQGLSLFDIGELSIMLPANEIQNHIAGKLDDLSSKVFQLIDATRASIDKLKERRAALITAAVTGQLDIRGKLPAVTSKPDRATWRVLVGAEIIHCLPDNPKRGRVKVHKLTYLAETHLGIDGLQGNYLRKAAGPLDRALIAETERGLEAAGYFRANQTDGTGTAVTYTPLAKAGQHKANLAALLGSKADDLRKLITTLADLDRRQTEAVATLYAVWNDALMDGQTPDDATIINGVLNDWHAEKGEKFTAADLTHWLAWMKRHTLIPRGQEPRTKPTMTPRML